VKGQAVLILGAGSAIARALAREMASRGARLHLAARDIEEVERSARDLEVRYQVPVTWSRVEATDYASHAGVIAEAARQMGGLDGVVVAFGYLGQQARARRDFDEVRRILDVNFTGAASLLSHAANYLEERKRGFLVGLASVAGDRGRASNYAYGAAKGALALYLSGLRQRLAGVGVRVLTVKPGFVDTPMTFGMPGLFLVAPPGQVARDIVRALERGDEVIYTPWFWWAIMSLLKALPEKVFKRLKL
jgi:short-subunit dehydrogenase